MKIFLTVLMMTFAVMSTASAEIYRQGVFYVIYDAEGSAAVNKTDVNLNGVPDVVEDIATQLNAAREVFNGVFNFPDPLTSERFANVTSIEITRLLVLGVVVPARLRLRECAEKFPARPERTVAENKNVQRRQSAQKFHARA